MKRKLLWKILLVLGVAPFVVALCSGLYAAVTGFSGLSILAGPEYGIEAFVNWIVLYSYVFCPTYLVGAILIIVSIVMMKR